ncbi:hypothetical protein [Enterococcus gallinarum]|uniref:hypothetical protein n=1 Tax=Enterococcus gallinarum TaxID=1353 RepID=UPI0018AAF35B|nr:hypothetical protein [Enterococcus gallinarum]
MKTGIVEGKKYRLRRNFSFSGHNLAKGIWIRVVEIAYPIAYCIADEGQKEVTMEINIQRLAPILDFSSETSSFGNCDNCHCDIVYQPKRGLNLDYLCNECVDKLGYTDK